MLPPCFYRYRSASLASVNQSPRPADPTWCVLQDVDELEEEDEDEDEGEGDEGRGEEASVRGRSPETPTLAVAPGKVRRNGKKRATSWRAALKGTALGGVDEVAEVEDPLTMPFVDAAGLAKNLLGKALASEWSVERARFQCQIFSVHGPHALAENLLNAETRREIRAVYCCVGMLGCG